MKLLRYEDPTTGPRRMPNIDNIMDGKIEMNYATKLSVLLDTNEVNVEDNGSKQSLGKQLIYLVEEN